MLIKLELKMRPKKGVSHHSSSALLGGRVFPSGIEQQGGGGAPVAEGEAEHAEHSPPAETADDGG